MYRACGRLNKQKVRHDRRAVADVTVYYLCPHMYDEVFIATMVLSYFPTPVSFLRSWSSQQHIIRRRVPDVPAFPGRSPNLLPIPAAHLERRRSGRRDNRRSIAPTVKYSAPGSFASLINSHHPPPPHPVATYRRLRPPIISRSDCRH